jgi:U6 snRNA-associated Sm-like protein LSm7
MSDRSSFRGASSRGSGRSGGAASGGRGGYGYRQHRGGGAAHQPHQPQPQTQQEKPKKENILDLTKYMDKEVNVKFNGGRESMYFSFFFPYSRFFFCVSRSQIWWDTMVVGSNITKHQCQRLRPD